MNEAFARFFQKKFTINANGQVCKSNGHKLTADEVFTQFRDLQEEAGNEVTITADDVREYITANTPKEIKSDEEDFSLKKFITDYLMRRANPANPSEREWRIGPAWKSIERVRKGIPVPSDMSELQNAIRAYAIDCNLGRAAKMDDIRCLLADMAMRNNEKQISEIASRIKYDASCIAAADEALNSLHDTWMIQQDQETFRTIMRHWCWQVKRKLMDLPTEWSLWVNLYGGTAIGKTTFLNDFAEPFGDFALTTSISKLLDEERQMLKLTSSYIINLDELSINNRETQYADKENQLNRDQQATLKSLLTQTRMQTRIMGGQRQTTRRLTFSCISSANEHLPDIIYDEKTMRRYYEFECKRERIVDFSPMDEIKKHISDIWKSVDETLEHGYWNPNCPVWEKTRAEQDAYYPTNTTTGMWIKEEGVVSCSKDESETDSLYEEYRNFCKDHGHMPKSYSKWITDIRHLVPGVNVSTHTFIRIQPEAE